MISAKIICDSINNNNRLTTFLITYPRWIHAEMCRHRTVSRSVQSSRAIKTEKMLKLVAEDPLYPVHWGKNQAGMQANEELNWQEKQQASYQWDAAREEILARASNLLQIGVHKQIANRILEPFCYVTEVVTATDWHNFFKLRCHKDAQPEIQEIAYDMLSCYMNGKPKELGTGQWHLPFADQYLEDPRMGEWPKKADLSIEQLKKISVARLARTSYLNFDGKIDFEKDYDLYEKLLSSKHWSPFEAVATPGQPDKYYGNFKGWKQHRKEFLNEDGQDNFDGWALLATRPNRKK